ncbi:hypothetical protein J2Y60_003155 [Arcicella sp. BE140]|nr:hypothetical protein [Arcicella sp. BE51]MDR6812945.1 hypothetical protein [Arcicella sp. BE140]MDR6824259.1 hypothetical protein [Arcicella sp. BE139]
MAINYQKAVMMLLDNYLYHYQTFFFTSCKQEQLNFLMKAKASAL